MCRIALEKARAALGTDDLQAFTLWGKLSTRPYMRAPHTLGLALWRQRKYHDAIAEFEEMLKRNPRDNQGVRYLIGPLCHPSGDLGGAVAAYKDASPDPDSVGDPTNELSFGLAWFQLKRHAAAVFRYRYAFFLNLYLPLVVLSRKGRAARHLARQQSRGARKCRGLLGELRDVVEGPNRSPALSEACI